MGKRVLVYMCPRCYEVHTVTEEQGDFELMCLAASNLSLPHEICDESGVEEASKRVEDEILALACFAIIIRPIGE